VPHWNAEKLCCTGALGTGRSKQKNPAAEQLVSLQQASLQTPASQKPDRHCLLGSLSSHTFETESEPTLGRPTSWPRTHIVVPEGVGQHTASLLSDGVHEEDVQQPRVQMDPVASNPSTDRG
jgi:hypothetical protein